MEYQNEGDIHSLTRPSYVAHHRLPPLDSGGYLKEITNCLPWKSSRDCPLRRLVYRLQAAKRRPAEAGTPALKLQVKPPHSKFPKTKLQLYLLTTTASDETQPTQRQPTTGRWRRVRGRTCL